MNEAAVEMTVKANPIAEATRQVMELISRKQSAGEAVADRDIERIIANCLCELHDYALTHNDGVTDIRASHWAIKAMAESIADTLHQCGGDNYVTCDMWTTKGPVVVTIQRKEGKSPAEIQDDLIGMLREMVAVSHTAAAARAITWLQGYDKLAAEKVKNCEKGFKKPGLLKRFLYKLATR